MKVAASGRCGWGRAGFLPFLLLGLVHSATSAKELPGEDLFQGAFVPNLHLLLSNDALAQLRDHPRTYIRATLREGQISYNNVAVRIKGGPGSFRPLDDLPAFTLNFDKFAPGQTFHGLKKIHLNNSVQDHSYLHEKVSRELFEAAGVPVPRAGNAWVNMNNRELGMYVLVEGVNKQFLKRYFKDAGGVVHDGHSGNDVDQSGWRDISSGEPVKYSQSRLHDLAEAARLSDLDERRAALEKTLDIDRFLSFVAVELMLGHWDGYTMNRNNFRIFHDRVANRMVFIPHGLDQTFGRRYAIFPNDVRGLVVRSVLEVPEFRKRYRERYAQIATNIFAPESLGQRITEVSARIAAVLARHNSEESEKEIQRATSLRKRVQELASYAGSQITPPVEFNSEGIMPLTHWSPKTDLGEPRLDQQRAENGTVLLHILTDAFCTASWRTTCDLPPGHYRLEARIRTRGVVFDMSDDRAGAGLRISRFRTGQKNTGDRDWTSISFGFSVEDEKPVELVCELRANKGEIWYDLSSLRLVRE